MPRLSERAVSKILIHSELYTAGHYAGKRDAYLLEAHIKKEFHADEILTISALMRNARVQHRCYWKTMRRIRLAQVIPFRVPVLREAV